MSTIKRLPRIAAGHGDQNIRHLKMPVARTCRHVAVNHRRNRLRNKISLAVSFFEFFQFALNSCRLKTAGNIVANHTKLIAVLNVNLLVQRHGFGFPFFKRNTSVTSGLSLTSAAICRPVIWCFTPSASVNRLLFTMMASCVCCRRE
jgi:hypothetical protein